MASWMAELNQSPFQAARKASSEQGVPLDEALDHELRERGYKQKEKDRLVLGLFDREKVEAQGLEVCLSREEKAQLEEVKAKIRPWPEWVRERKALEDLAASTVVNWQTKLKGLANWYGSNVVGTMTRRDANAYKLHMKEKGMSSTSISNYLVTFSGFWNWAIASGEKRVIIYEKDLERGFPLQRKEDH